jgi:hypothetical protein
MLGLRTTAGIDFATRYGIEPTRSVTPWIAHAGTHIGEPSSANRG